MSYLIKLRKQYKETNSIVCMGIDPILEKIPISGTPKEKISEFYMDILEAMKTRGIFPAIIKPNIAYFEQYGIEGLEALRIIVQSYKRAGIPVLIDAKRGDIGATSKAYADSLFKYWEADAVTIAPYMGSDSVSPFIDYCKQGKGVYILVRTSNKGAKDFQDLKIGHTPLYVKVAEKVLEWYQLGLGVVIGATYPKELEELSELFVKSGKEVPMLIPGVGAQGGSIQDVIMAMKNTRNELYLHRINSSSAINYAYLAEDTDDYANAAVDAIKKMNDEIEKLKWE